MVYLGKALATLFVWAAVTGLCYLFNSFGFFSGAGAVGMVFAGLVGTGIVWGTRVEL